MPINFHLHTIQFVSETLFPTSDLHSKEGKRTIYTPLEINPMSWVELTVKGAVTYFINVIGVSTTLLTHYH